MHAWDQLYTRLEKRVTGDNLKIITSEYKPHLEHHDGWVWLDKVKIAMKKMGDSKGCFSNTHNLAQF